VRAHLLHERRGRAAISTLSSLGIHWRRDLLLIHDRVCVRSCLRLGIGRRRGSLLLLDLRLASHRSFGSNVIGGLLLVRGSKRRALLVGNVMYRGSLDA
jgi:hypothetical protein